jgi:hypothetical protein
MFRLPYISRRWKWPKALIALLVLELGGTVAALALFGIASPDLYRTKLWQVGNDNGFNSSPLEILYAYANYRPIPHIPFVWTKTLTDFNVAISVLSMFILLVKVVMFVLHIWYPLLGTIVNATLTVMWVVSIYGQAGPDHSDPLHPSNVAWYVSKSCKYAVASGGKNYHYCIMAKATFATTVVMAAIFFLNMALGIWSLIPSKRERSLNRMAVDDMQKHSPVSDRDDKEWEMTGLRPGPKTPYTPRTLAFNTLDRQLPLRTQYA